MVNQEHALPFKHPSHPHLSEKQVPCPGTLGEEVRKSSPYLQGWLCGIFLTNAANYAFCTVK